MFKFACVLLLTIGVLAGGDPVTEGTTLVQTFLIHRHGDRTPVEETIALTTDPVAVDAASAQYGYGQLTEVGKQRSYQLGQYIRERYSSLLSPQYNRSEIYIRSTDSTRTKMTALTAMAAVYPAYPGSWSAKVNWVPVPYTTVPAKYDFNLANLNCPNFLSSYYSAMLVNPPRMEEYADVMEALANYSGINLVKSLPIMSYGFYDAFISQESLGIPLDDEIVAIMPRLKEAAGVAIDILFGDDDKLELLAGVLLNEFFTYTSKIIAGEDTPRVRIYSAHDINVFSFMAAAQITPRQGVPKYGSAFSLELRRVDETGNYVVLAVYKADPTADLVYLPVAGCGSILCDLDQYRGLVSKYLLDEDTWRSECGFTEDLEIDDSSIA